MNKIILEHIPAAELPEKLRPGINPAANVTLTVQEETQARIKSPAELRQMIKEARNASGSPGISTDEAVARIRALRDEWD